MRKNESTITNETTTKMTTAPQHHAPPSCTTITTHNHHLLQHLLPSLGCMHRRLECPFHSLTQVIRVHALTYQYTLPDNFPRACPHCLPCTLPIVLLPVDLRFEFCQKHDTTRWEQVQWLALGTYRHEVALQGSPGLWWCVLVSTKQVTAVLCAPPAAYVICVCTRGGGEGLDDLASCMRVHVSSSTTCETWYAHYDIDAELCIVACATQYTTLCTM